LLLEENNTASFEFLLTTKFGAEWLHFVTYRNTIMKYINVEPLG
jgi:hypothetical protein